MATDWRDIIRRGSAHEPQADPVAQQQTPEMARLLAERSALEARMAALTGGGEANAARYPVTPLAQRRADHRRWENDREEARRKTLAEPRPAPRAAPVPARAAAAPQPPPGGTPVDPRRWYARRDAAVTNPEPRARPPVAPSYTPSFAPAATAPKAPPVAASPKPAPRPRAAEPTRSIKADPPPRPAARRAKGELMPVRPVKPVKSVAAPRPPAARKPVDPLTSRDVARAAKPRELPQAPRARTPAKPDAAPREPARAFGSDLRRAVTDTLDRPIARRQVEKIGADRIAKPKEKIQKPLEKAREALDSANRATRTLSDAWDKRRDRIAGPDLDRYTQGYDARKARLLGVETGSLNDMAQRSERQREAGIARRAEARRSEAADENRRSRAQQNRLDQRQQERKAERQ
jgi:hypothetical protein